LYGSSRIGELCPDESDQNTYRKATSRDGQLYTKEVEPVKEELKEAEAVEEKTMGLSIFNEWDYKKDTEDLQAPELVDDPKKSQIIIGLTDEDIAKIKEQLYSKEVQLDEVRRQQLEQDLARGYTLAQARSVPPPTLEQYYGPSYHMKWRYRGNRHYELDNHLGNVQVVITDKKIAHGNDNWEYYTADILSVHDYYAFGQDIEERSFERDKKYRYGMNGQEKDDDVFVGAFSAQYWEYDSRIGRRWNIDPVDQVSISNYACFGDNPIRCIDPNGMKVLNGYRTEKNNAEKDKNEQIKSFEEKYKSNRQMTNKDFGNDKNLFKQYKKDRTVLESAEKKFEKAKDRFDQTEAMIKDLSVIHPDLFNKIDGLSTNVYVAVDDEISQPGETNYSVDPDGVVQSKNREGITFRNAFCVSIQSSGPANRLAHEFGHVFDALFDEKGAERTIPDRKDILKQMMSKPNCREMEYRDSPRVAPAIKTESEFDTKKTEFDKKSKNK
jgi:RHS repeat-associated protein